MPVRLRAKGSVALSQRTFSKNPSRLTVHSSNEIALHARIINCSRMPKRMFVRPIAFQQSGLERGDRGLRVFLGSTATGEIYARHN